MEKTHQKKIEAVITLLKESRQPLLAIKSIESIDKDFYIKKSTQVASIALNTIIEVVNTEQSDLSLRLDLQSGRNSERTTKFKTLLKSCYDAIELIGKMDLSNDFAKHYKSNRATIHKICINLGIINEPNGIGDGCMVALISIMGITAMSLCGILLIL